MEHPGMPAQQNSRYGRAKLLFRRGKYDFIDLFNGQIGQFLLSECGKLHFVIPLFLNHSGFIIAGWHRDCKKKLRIAKMARL